MSVLKTVAHDPSAGALTQHQEVVLCGFELSEVYIESSRSDKATQ